MRRTKLYVVLLALGLSGYGLPGQGFCADYTQHEDFGVKGGGDIVSFTVTPPGRVLSGRVDSPGGFIWMGGPASWSGTIPPDFSGVHNGLFSGTYQPPPGGPGPSREYTWEVDTKAMVEVAGFATDGVVGVYGNNAQIKLTANAAIDGRDYSLPPDFYCSGSGCNGTLSTNPAIPGVFSVTKSINITGGNKIIGSIITNGISRFSTNYWQDQANALIPQATITLPGGNIAGNMILGTWDNPEITLITGNTKISGNVDGAGILIVMNNIEVELVSTFHYEGIVILIGDNKFTAQGNARIFGALVAIGDGVDIRVQGSARIMHSSEALANLNKLPLNSQPPRLSIGGKLNSRH